MKAVKLLTLNLGLVLLTTGCDPMEEMYKTIRDYGYITYETPLAHSGPGTLVGGRPSAMSLVSEPSTCFPKAVDGVATELYVEDHTSIPKRHHKVDVSGNANLKLIDFMSVGNPVLAAGVEFSRVSSVSLEMDGVHVLYLDSVKLKRFYDNAMAEDCKHFLEDFGFVIQALKADQLKFTFYSKTGGAITLDLENLERLVDLGVDIDWDIENEVTLVINSPKYIGFQLGRLLRRDNGIALYRANRVRWDKYVFESLSLFRDDEEAQGLGLMNVPVLHTVNPSQFEAAPSVDRSAIYLD